MKREIKFRVWNGVTRKMWNPETLTDDENDTFIALYGDKKRTIGYGLYDRKLENRLASGEDEENELLQFTGQKDCNEREIYEGDIVKTGTDKVMVIGWSQKHASFVIDREGWAFIHYFGEAFDGKDCEVIGNKYENPELLLPACETQKY